MDTLFNKISQSLPPNLLEKIDIEDYSNQYISIIKVKNAFGVPNSFDLYKFILPLTSEYPLEIVDKDYYRLKKNNIFPLNPKQLHCSETFEKTIIDIKPFLAIFIKKEFIQHYSKQLFENGNIKFINNNYPISHELKSTINSFIEEFKSKEAGYQLVLEKLAGQMVIYLLRELDSNLNKNALRFNTSDKKSIDKAIYFLKNNYDKEFSLDEIAAKANYSPYHFIRVFKAETGKTPFQYLLEIKIAKAKELLDNSSKPITEICYDCGFNNRSHFSVIFKRKTGNTPSSYRKLLHKN